MYNKRWIIRFWSRVVTGKEHECWYFRKVDSTEITQNRPCFGCTNAARIAYRLVYGPIAEGMLICHTCDNELCVNPAHLYQGTPSQNAQDAWDRNRHPLIKDSILRYVPLLMSHMNIRGINEYIECQKMKARGES